MFTRQSITPFLQKADFLSRIFDKEKKEIDKVEQDTLFQKFIKQPLERQSKIFERMSYPERFPAIKEKEEVVGKDE